jgi:hypothetical protein
MLSLAIGRHISIACPPTLPIGTIFDSRQDVRPKIGTAARLGRKRRRSWERVLGRGCLSDQPPNSRNGRREVPPAIPRQPSAGARGSNLSQLCPSAMNLADQLSHSPRVQLLGYERYLRMAHHRDMQSHPTGLKFLHRIGKYRRVESVCMTCFSTVSHTWDDCSLTAEELIAVESSHGCAQKQTMTQP